MASRFDTIYFIRNNAGTFEAWRDTEDSAAYSNASLSALLAAIRAAEANPRFEFEESRGLVSLAPPLGSFADDLGHVQEMLDEFVDATILFQPGTYRLSDSLVYYGGQKLLGLGASKKWDGARGSGPTIQLLDGVTLTDDGAGYDGVLVPDTWDRNITGVGGGTLEDPTIIENLHVVGAKWANNNINIAGIVSYGYWQEIVGCMISDCEGDGIHVAQVTRDGSANTDGGLGSEILITRNRIENCDRDLVHVAGVANNSDGHLAHNFLDGAGRDAVHLESAIGWDISHNHTYNIQRHAIYAPQGYAAQINHNYIEDFGVEAAAATDYYGIFTSPTVTGGRGAVIAGNSIASAEAGTGDYKYIVVDATNLSGDWNAAITGNSLRTEDFPPDSVAYSIERTGMTGQLEVAISGNADQSITSQATATAVEVIGTGGTLRVKRIPDPPEDGNPYRLEYDSDVGYAWVAA